MSEKKQDHKDLKAILSSYLRYWYFFVIGAGLALIISLIYLRYATPIYSASTMIILKSEKGGDGPNEMSALGDIALMNQTRSLDNEILMFQSKELMRRVVEELHLEVAFISEGSVRDVELFAEGSPIKVIINNYSPSFYGKSFKIIFKNDNTFELRDGQSNTYRFGEEIEKPYGKFTIVSDAENVPGESAKPLTVKFRNLDQLAAMYASRLGVAQVKKNTSALRLTIHDPVPEKASAILRKLLKVYELENREDKNKIAQKTVDFLNERLEYLTQELNSVEMNVENYKQQHELTDVETQAQQYLQAASEVRKQVEEIDIQLAVLRSIESYLQNTSGDAADFKLVPSTLTIQDATLNGLILKFNELQLDRQRIMRTSRANNPAVINIDEQLKNLRVNILENLKNIKNGLYITRRNLLAKSGQMGDKIQKVPVMQRQMVEITREQEIKQSLYLYLLQKKEEAALSLAATVSNMRVVDEPKYFGPVSPQKTNILAYSVLLGIFIPFAGIYLKDLLSKKIERRADVEARTRTPILGEICHEPSESIVVARPNERTPIAEMFRLLRTNLRFSMAGKENKVILITSSMSEEGKTFMSINLGVALAGAGHKVLIIEFDLRRPKLLKRLDQPKTKGLVDYLVGDIQDLNSVILDSQIDPNLKILSAGTLPPNPAEIILDPRVGELIDSMRKEYDFILLDCPPVGKVADALTLNDHIDSSIYVVRYNKTDKQQIDIADEIFRNHKLNNMLLVLNDAKKSNNGNYTYGY